MSTPGYVVAGSYYTTTVPVLYCTRYIRVVYTRTVDTVVPGSIFFRIYLLAGKCLKAKGVKCWTPEKHLLPSPCTSEEDVPCFIPGIIISILHYYPTRQDTGQVPYAECTTNKCTKNSWETGIRRRRTTAYYCCTSTRYQSDRKCTYEYVRYFCRRIVAIEMYILFSISLVHSSIYLKKEVMRLSTGGTKIRNCTYVLVSTVYDTSLQALRNFHEPWVLRMTVQQYVVGTTSAPLWVDRCKTFSLPGLPEFPVSSTSTIAFRSNFKFTQKKRQFRVSVYADSFRTNQLPFTIFRIKQKKQGRPVWIAFTVCSLIGEGTPTECRQRVHKQQSGVVVL